jgi:hypothetical protein
VGKNGDARYKTSDLHVLAIVILLVDKAAFPSTGHMLSEQLLVIWHPCL